MTSLFLGNESFWTTRLLLQRGLALVYGIGFLVALQQFRPLLGERGLLPVTAFVQRVPFRFAPSLFYLAPKDWAFAAAAWAGLALSVIALFGLSERGGLGLSMGIWGAMWLLYLSFVNVGQTFYSFGWESILLEAGFYAVFLGSADVEPPRVTIWMFRWLLFRLMFGAGLIKLRGDSCWKDGTCLDYHYETQPMPNALSWFFHNAAPWTHRAGVWFNHLVELLVPFGLFFRGLIADVAGLLTIVFQATIMASGNLSWLNFLTLVLSIPAFHDRWFSALMFQAPALRVVPWFDGSALALGGIVVLLSVRPILNMISPNQVMNTNYNPFHLVGTYGAFGSVTETRYEIVIEGTEDAALTPATVWKAYEFRGKPGDPARRPPQIAPYHLRLDWLLWFAAMGRYQNYPWFSRLIRKLLVADRPTLSLLRSQPFEGRAPRFVRADLYEYHFTTPAERRETGLYWRRRRVAPYFPAVALQSPLLAQNDGDLEW